MSNHTHEVIKGIMAGNILETFDAYYADDCVMTENGENARVGKSANREYEEQFVNNVEFHAAEVARVVVDGDHSAIEWIFDFTPKGGERVTRRQASFQTWKDGKIQREDFYYT